MEGSGGLDWIGLTKEVKEGEGEWRCLVFQFPISVLVVLVRRGIVGGVVGRRLDARLNEGGGSGVGRYAGSHLRDVTSYVSKGLK